MAEWHPYNNSKPPVMTFPRDLSSFGLHIYIVHIYSHGLTHTYINKALKYIWKGTETEGVVVSNDLEVRNSCVVVQLISSSGPLGKKWSCKKPKEFGLDFIVNAFEPRGV